jgi:hypothetical protein
MIKYLFLFLITSCTSLKCLKDCGIFPDGCMSACKREEKYKDFCRDDGGLEKSSYYSFKCVKSYEWKEEWGKK